MVKQRAPTKSLRIIKRLVSKNNYDWDQKLDFALWAFRNAFKGFTGFTPFKLVYGLEAVVPMEFLVPSLRIAAENKLSLENLVNHRLDQLLELEEDILQSAYVA